MKTIAVALSLVGLSLTAGKDDRLERLKKQDLKTVILQSFQCGGVSERGLHGIAPTNAELLACKDYFDIYTEAHEHERKAE